MKKPKMTATAMAIAGVVALSVFASDVHALALGRVTVQSALGEPLRANIEIPEINADEIASLRAAVASPDAFRAAGLEFSPAIANVRITLERRPDGRHFLRLTSDRPVTEPFLDLILEANWSSGRVVRDYTMLFDPPNLRQNTAPPAMAQVAPPAAATQSARSAPAATMAPPSPAPAAARAAAPAPRAAAVDPTPPASAGRPASLGGERVTVQPGDTAGRLASTYKPATISLDQMLVAMLRANPDAFLGGNVNRLKAGAVLELPTAEQAGSTGAGEARQTIVAQSRDFNDYRRRLAEGLPAAAVAAPERQATGRVQTEVQDRQPAAAAPDKLTLSKGGVAGKAAEEKIARDRAARDAATRVAELNKNIADLNKLGTTTGAVTPASAARPATPVTPAAPTASAAAPAVARAAPAVQTPAAAPAATPAPAPVAAVATPAPSLTPTPAPAPAASAPAQTPVAAAVVAPAASAPGGPGAAVSPGSTASATDAAVTPAATAASAATATAPLAVTTAAAKPPVPVTAPGATDPSLVDELLENPIVPAAAGGLLALLLGFAFFRARQRKKAAQVDSSFLESRLQPDSFFGASGGQRIDTAEGASVTGSSMVYSPSQLDAAGDVDPVAEADVYLAYGRDLQAEEILKEALRTNPQRVAIHSKLLEIYSKRRDGKAFEQGATEAYTLTRGEGQEWEHICTLGRELDPANPLYRPGGQPVTPGSAVGAGALAAASFGAGNSTQPMPMDSPPGSTGVDLDLDLDFSLGDEQFGASPQASSDFLSDPTIAIPAARSPASAAQGVDFGAGSTVPLNRGTLPPQESHFLQNTQPVTALEAPNLTLPDEGFDFSPEPAKASSSPAADSGMIEFDLGALSLDLDDNGRGTDVRPETPQSTAGALLDTAGTPLAPVDFNDGDDPLATKLALAEEFSAIGDPDGARSLAEEVRAEASGELKGRAERLLAELG